LLYHQIPEAAFQRFQPATFAFRFDAARTRRRRRP
jgi:hypothetical protein